MPENEDKTAIGRVLAGETEAFRYLVEKYERPLFALLHGLLRNPSDCEEIAQDAFLAAYDNLRSFDAHRASFSTWLLTIARNRAVNLLKRKREVAMPERIEIVDTRLPEAEASRKELFRLLDRMLQELPLAQRTAFVLAEIQQLSYGEVARIEDVNVGTVKSRVSRAKQKLRSVFQRTIK